MRKEEEIKKRIVQCCLQFALLHIEKNNVSKIKKALQALAEISFEVPYKTPENDEPDDEETKWNDLDEEEAEVINAIKKKVISDLSDLQPVTKGCISAITSFPILVNALSLLISCSTVPGVSVASLMRLCPGVNLSNDFMILIRKITTLFLKISK